MKKTYTVNIKYKDGKKAEAKNVYRTETEEGLNGEPIFITFDEYTPIHFPLIDGMTVEFTEENVEKS